MANSRFTIGTRRPGRTTKNDGLSVIVLCGNMGYRMKSYGPKSLLTFPDGSMVIDKLLENVQASFPDCELIVSVGFEADKVMSNLNQGIHVVENQLYETTNDLEEVRLCLNVAINNNVVIINGDLIFNNIALDKLTKNGSKVVIDEHMNNSEIGVTVVDDKVTIFAYDLPTKWCNIVYLTGEELAIFKKICKDREKGKWFIFEALNVILEKGGTFHVSHPKHMEINRIEKLKDWKALI